MKLFKGKVKKRHKDELKVMLAQDFTQADVHRHWQDKMSLEVDPSLVSYYAEQFSEQIMDMRTRYNEQLITQAPISTKEYRLRIFQRLLDDIMANLWLTIPKVQRNVEKDGALTYEVIDILKGNHDIATKILLAVNKEQEGQEAPETFTDILTASREVQTHYIKTGEHVTEVEIQAMKLKIKVTESNNSKDNGGVQNGEIT